MGDIKQQNKEEGQQSLFQERSLMNEVYPPYDIRNLRNFVMSIDTIIWFVILLIILQSLT